MLQPCISTLKGYHLCSWLCYLQHSDSTSSKDIEQHLISELRNGSVLYTQWFRWLQRWNASHVVDCDRNLSCGASISLWKASSLGQRFGLKDCLLPVLGMHLILVQAGHSGEGWATFQGLISPSNSLYTCVPEAFQWLDLRKFVAATLWFFESWTNPWTTLWCIQLLRCRNSSDANVWFPVLGVDFTQTLKVVH